MLIYSSHHYFITPRGKNQLVFGFNELKDIKTHNQFASMCSEVLDDVPPNLGHPLPLFLAFAKCFLQDYKRRELRDYSSFPEFQDWVLAAKIWEEKVWSKVVTET